MLIRNVKLVAAAGVALMGAAWSVQPLSLFVLGPGYRVPAKKSAFRFVAPTLAVRLFYARHKLPRIGRLAPGTYAIDTHVHTCFSPDSDARPERVLRRAVERGLSAIAITDHGTMAGLPAARAALLRLQAAGEAPRRFLIIPGEEVSSRDGHVGALFVSRFVPNGLSAAATVAAIHRRGGLAVAVHPYLRSGVGNRAASLPFDAVELYNGAVFRTAVVRQTAWLAAGPNLAHRAHLGASDSHFVEDVGCNYTVVDAGKLSLASLKRAIVRGRTVPVGDPNNLQGYVSRHPGSVWAALALSSEHDAPAAELAAIR